MLRCELTEVRVRVRTGDRVFYGAVQHDPQGWTRMLFGGLRDRSPYYHSGTTGVVSASFIEAFDALIHDIGRIWEVNVARPWLLEEDDQ